MSVKMIEKPGGSPSRRRASGEYKNIARVGYVTIILTFGVLGGWAATAPLGAGAIAPGVVGVESNRKVVQHYEGGIIGEIFVREAQEVAKGELLFQIDNTASRANAELVRNQRDAALALEARLLAERTGAKEIDFPQEVLDRSQNPIVKAAISDQISQFNERRGSIKGQVDILESRKRQLETEISGLEREKASTGTQIEFLDEELGVLRELFKKGLQSKARLNSLERERARLEGVIGRTTAEIAKAENGIGEAQLQVEQLQQQFQEEVAASILETRQRLSDLQERVIIAEDVLRRVDIRAPLAGVVQNLTVFTIGQVIKSGEPLMEIVPEAADLIINAQISPLDIDNVMPGMAAEIRFPSFKQRNLPIVMGEVLNVSSDRLVDEATNQPYYLAQVKVDAGSLPPEKEAKLTAGMPADIIIPTLERTALQYVMSPLTDTLSRAMREE